VGLKRLGLMLLLLASLTLIFKPALIVRAASFELAHDDGEFDYGWSDFYPYAAAVKFSSPSQSWRVTAVRLHGVCILRGSQVFYVEIWDSNLNTKHQSVFLLSNVFKNATLDWYTIELPNIVVTGEFYVVIVPMLTLDGSQLWISIDDDPPVANTSFIMNVDEHTIHASLNSTSSRPGDFMIRVVGEPAPAPPELRLSSVEFGEDETTVVFTYSGESLNFGARLVKPDGSFTEENVTRLGNSLIVRTRGEGMLNVFVVTPSYEVIGASVRLESSLRTLYRDLLANYTVLKHDAEKMLRQIDSLVKDSENLRLQLNQSQALIRIQDERINKLLGNVSSLRGELEKIRAEASGLGGENALLKTGLVIAVVISLSLGFLGVRRRWVGK
jgi:hypothetical protein